MPSSPRTYRFVATLMAVLLLMGGMLPLVQHACAMMGAKMTLADRCCCGDEVPMPQHTQHETPAAPASELPCHDEEVPVPAPAYSGVDCCTAEVTRTVTDETTLPSQPLDPHAGLTLLLLAEVFSDHRTPGVHVPVLDTGPPLAPPTPFHILHGSFLS